MKEERARTARSTVRLDARLQASGVQTEPRDAQIDVDGVGHAQKIALSCASAIVAKPRTHYRTRPAQHRVVIFVNVTGSSDQHVTRVAPHTATAVRFAEVRADTRTASPQMFPNAIVALS